MKTAVIVPAYNEEKHLSGEADTHFLESLKQWRDEDPKNRQAVVIDDGSTDKTAKICRDAGIEVIPSDKSGKNVGKGGAFITGAKHVLANEKELEAIVMLDADLYDVTPEKINKFVERLFKGKKKNMLLARIFEGNKKSPTSSIYIGIRAIKVTNAFKGLLTTPWFVNISKGYGLEVALNHGIKPIMLSKISFRSRRPFRRFGLGMRQWHQVSRAHAKVIDRSITASILRRYMRAGNLEGAKDYLEFRRKFRKHIR